jgi:hypothetical protein
VSQDKFGSEAAGQNGTYLSIAVPQAVSNAVFRRCLCGGHQSLVSRRDKFVCAYLLDPCRLRGGSRSSHLARLAKFEQQQDGQASAASVTVKHSTQIRASDINMCAEAVTLSPFLQDPYQFFDRRRIATGKPLGRRWQIVAFVRSFRASSVSQLSPVSR